MTDKNPVTIDGATGAVESIPPQRGKRYRCRLDSLGDVKSEMSRVYREARSGVVDISDSTKLVYILVQVARVIETSDLEQRIQKLEENQNESTR